MVSVWPLDSEEMESDGTLMVSTQDPVTPPSLMLSSLDLPLPAKAVRPGDVLTIAAPHRTAVIRILSAGERRGPASEAAGLYETLDEGDNRTLVTGAPDD